MPAERGQAGIRIRNAEGKRAARSIECDRHNGCYRRDFAIRRRNEIVRKEGGETEMSGSPAL